MSRRGRITALENPTGAGELYLHLPSSGDDHAAVWAKAAALGQRVGVVHYRGLDDAAVAEFMAAKPGCGQ